MKAISAKNLISSAVLVSLLSVSGGISAGEPLTLKQTMKEMRLHYKEALDARSPEVFAKHIDLFKTHLKSAQAYDFSPERKVISLEGLNKVEAIVTGLPDVTSANLAAVQQQFEQVDDLRTKYHKEAKPSPWDLFWDIFK